MVHIGYLRFMKQIYNLSFTVTVENVHTETSDTNMTPLSLTHTHILSFQLLNHQRSIEIETTVSKTVTGWELLNFSSNKNNDSTIMSSTKKRKREREGPSHSF